MNSLHSLIGQQVELLISGKKLPINGKLIDQGSDLLVVRTVEKFLYIPLLHLQQLTLSKDLEEEPMTESEPPFENQPDISYRKTLMNAKGFFSEIYITGNQSLHGYVTSIMNDFFVFYSPVFHSVYIPLQHIYGSVQPERDSLFIDTGKIPADARHHNVVQYVFTATFLR
jgi:hypothetical protein